MLKKPAQKISLGYVVEFVDESGNVVSVHQDLQNERSSRTMVELLNRGGLLCRRRQVALRLKSDGTYKMAVSARPSPRTPYPAVDAAIEPHTRPRVARPR